MEDQGKPKSNWVSHAYRVLTIIDNQVRSLRKRTLIGSYISGRRNGTFWGIRSKIDNYGLSDTLPCPMSRTIELADVPTRLKRMDNRLQERLVNWGFAICDAAIRKHVDPSLSAPNDFPYPEAQV
jgi:NTE family protein